MERSLQELAVLVQGKVVGDGNTKVSSLTSVDLPKAGSLTFVTDNRGLKEAEVGAFAAIICPEDKAPESKPAIQSKLPKLAWAVLLGLFHPPQTFSGTISKQASVAPSARLGKNVTVEAFAVIGEHVTIDNGAAIRAHAFVDDHSQIGEASVIHPYVMIYRNTVIGKRVVIHAGTVVGTDGFGYVFDGVKQAKVPQIGNVVIEDDVEIGSASAIDRATVGSTTIHKGVKIDNLVQIAHNCDIGEHTCLSAQVGISGSSKVGKFVTMGGRCGLGDHTEVGDQAILGAQTGLPSGKKIPSKQIWIGAPARPYQEMRRQVGAQLRSYETQQLVAELKKRVEELEKKIKVYESS
jgi:UDP-3-O-[3-hydroxymyristoyl] glucosamine N-acyltransferase